ncbi:hypothetical protein BC829DRAFT_271147 [Chytridium lagenaria]|nr:hypothetical protein BC829DRAFT_271147 [Chytridium lagenaria]
MMSSADILGFTMAIGGPSFIEKLRREADVKCNPLPLKGGSINLLDSVAGKGSNGKPNANDLLLTAHTDSTVKFWHTDDSPMASTSQPSLLYTMDLKGHINLTKGTPNAPSSTLVHVDVREGSLIISSGTVVLIFKHEGRIGESRTADDNKEYTAEDVEQLMKELDDTIDGVLDELKESKTLNDEVVEDVPLDDDDNGPEPVNADDGPTGPPPPPTKDELVEPLREDVKPQLPPRLAPGPPLPPRTGSSRPSPEGGVPNLDVNADMVSNPTVVIDRLSRKNPSAIKGWVPQVSAIYMNNVASVCFAGWLNVLAVTTTDGTLTIADVSTGKTIMTDSFQDSAEGLPIEIVLLHFAESYFDREPHMRPILFVGTAEGAVYAYGLTEWRADTPRQVIRKICLIKPSTAFLDDPSLFSSYNRPLMIAILNENGVQVTQQNVKSNENYVVFTGSRSATVLLLEPLKAPQIVSERSFVAQLQGLLGNVIVTRRSASPGNYIIQAGIAVVKSGPVVLTVTRDGP